MRSIRPSYLTTLTLVLALNGAAYSTRASELEAVRLDTPPVIDGILDDEAWAQTKPVSGLVQLRPFFGEPSPVQTDMLFENHTAGETRRGGSCASTSARSSKRGPTSGSRLGGSCAGRRRREEVGRHRDPRERDAARRARIGADREVRRLARGRPDPVRAAS